MEPNVIYDLLFCLDFAADAHGIKWVKKKELRDRKPIGELATIFLEEEFPVLLDRHDNLRERGQILPVDVADWHKDPLPACDFKGREVSFEEYQEAISQALRVRVEKAYDELWENASEHMRGVLRGSETNK